MLDLDKYINNNVEMKIGGEVIHVKQPSIGMIDRIEAIELDLNEDNAMEKRLEIAVLMLNNNEEGRTFAKEDLRNWTQEAMLKVITTISKLRYEAETDPN